jgi:hypothetical protein
MLYRDTLQIIDGTGPSIEALPSEPTEQRNGSSTGSCACQQVAETTVTVGEQEQTAKTPTRKKNSMAQQRKKRISKPKAQQRIYQVQQLQAQKKQQQASQPTSTSRPTPIQKPALGVAFAKPSKPTSPSSPKRRKLGWLRRGFKKKTSWDWLQLMIQLLTALALPIALFLGAQWFNTQQSQESQWIANDQQKETILKTYLDDMSNLLLTQHLSTSMPGEIVREVAKERTLTTLRSLDAHRNTILLQFLQEAHLIGIQNAVIDLSIADLSNDDLSGAVLSGTDLSDSVLKCAFLYDGNM